MTVSSARARFALLVAVFLTSGMTRAAEPTIEEVFNRVHSSVVTIYTEKRTGLVNADGKAQTVGGNGSGVLIDGGRILTAAHVIHSADTVVVRYADGTQAPARTVGSVVQADVAMIQLDSAPPQGVRPAVLADSDQVRIGSRCFVIGAPHNLTHSLTVGYISARRAVDHPTLDILDVEHLQTDAQINPGNSGGPMFNMDGEVIGIVVHNITSTGGSVGLGFAVSSNTTRHYLLDRNPVWSGMTEMFLSGNLAQAFQLPEGESGFLIQHVAKDSPADKLGIRGGSIPVTIGETTFLIGGDILLQAFGNKLDSPGRGLALLGAMQGMSPDQQVTATVLRGGRLVELKARASDIAPWLKK